MEVKPGSKSTEWMALIAGVILAAAPVVMEMVPKESAVYVVLGVLVSIAAYIGGRSHVKATAIKAEALKAAAKPDPS